MDISANVAAALALLTDMLEDDGAGADLAASLQQVAADAAGAVPSFLGLTVTQLGVTPPFAITAMESGADDVRSSLLLPLPDGRSPPLGVILYAATPGAFVDLAADLAWMLGRPLTDFAVDQHVRPPPDPDAVESLHALSLINQAIGVLIGQGYRPADAGRALDARAAAAGHTRQDAARVILRGLPGGAGDQPPEVS